jgi:hypothetical protein
LKGSQLDALATLRVNMSLDHSHMTYTCGQTNEKTEKRKGVGKEGNRLRQEIRRRQGSCRV